MGQASTWHLYAVGPIDWWDCCTSLSFSSREPPLEEDPPFLSLPELARIFHWFESIGWEGDTHGLWAFRLPCPDSCGWMWAYAIKQSNKGTTFIASPVPLPWLEQDGGVHVTRVFGI